MTTLRLPLRIGSPYSQLLSPFGINGKGYYLEVTLPLRTCSPKHQALLCEESI